MQTNAKTARPGAERKRPDRTPKKQAPARKAGPQTAQQTIPYREIFKDGICRVNDRLYTKSILVICTWGALMYFTQKDRCTQRVALIINMVLGGVSLIAFVLSFWDVNSQVVLWIGFPCEILFYGFKLFWDWICIYSVVTVLAIVGIEYSKRNLSEQSTK